MAEGQKVGEVFVEIGGDSQPLIKELSFAEQAVAKFQADLTAKIGQQLQAEQAAAAQRLAAFQKQVEGESSAFLRDFERRSAATSRFAARNAKSYGPVIDQLSKIGKEARGLVVVFTRLTGIIAVVGAAFEAFRRIGAKIESVINRDAVAAEAAANKIKELNDEFSKFIADNKSRSTDALTEEIDKIAESVIEQKKRLNEVIFADDVDPEVRSRAIEQSRKLTEIQIEEEKKVRERFRKEQADKDAENARDTAEKEKSERLRAIDEYNAAARKLALELADEKGKIELEYQIERERLEREGFHNLIAELDKVKEKRLRDLRDEQLERDRKAQEEFDERERREQEQHERDLDRARELAAEQRRLDAQRFQSLDLSASSGGDAVRLLRSIERSSRAAAQRRFPLGASANGGGV